MKINIAERIRLARENKGYDQITLAKKVDVASRTVQRWEGGLQVPDSNYLIKLAKHTNVRPEWLLTGDGEMYYPPQPKGKVIPFNQEALLRKVTMVDLPVLSTVPAGKTAAIFHPEYVEKYITVDNIKDPRAFALIVKGKSMFPMIEDGDIVVVSPQQEVRSGDICVIRVNDEDVLKKIKIDDDFVHLIPINTSFEPISVRKRDVTFLWKVVRVIKNL
ncbi:MAG: helix-turn-helix domain-containing protein [Ignavibacteriales bacterium]|nr:helix-turn-helix domain-containing protein [Ignavibacteriales bacterium]